MYNEKDEKTTAAEGLFGVRQYFIYIEGNLKRK